MALNNLIIFFVFWCSLLLLPSVNSGFLQGLPNINYRYDININFRMEIAFPATSNNLPYRLEVSSPNAKREFPVLIVVRQERSVTSWQLPLLVESHLNTTTEGMLEYLTSARTLCHAPLNHTQSDAKIFKTNFTVGISTFSTSNVIVYLRAIFVDNYFLESDKQYNITISPSEPVYYFYQFPPNHLKTVHLKITSDDDVCFTVSVQPNICPIYDLNDDITYQGSYQTVTRKGGLVVYKKRFMAKTKKNYGFVVVFVAKGDNYDCDIASALQGESEEIQPKQMQQSKVSFTVLTAKHNEEYVIAIFGVVGFNLILCLVILIVTYLFYRFGNYYNLENYDEPRNTIQPNEEEVDARLDSKNPKLSDFIFDGKKNQKKALFHFWHTTNIAIFYGLPVMQLMVFYQRTVDFSGDMDLCYYNTHCAHPLYFTDFNHVFSNIGYIMFGVLFLLITIFRNLYVKNKDGCGVPKLYGLYYAMGVALIFEGVLSASYHICPNQSNFQFDTSFMYVMAIFIMVKLYQNRHPDIQAGAHRTFTFLGIGVILAMFGILYNSVVVMIIFFISYVLFCVYMAFKMYFFMNAIKGIKAIYNEVFREETPITEILKPKRKRLFTFLLIGLFLNFSMAIGGFVLYPKSVDFGTYLLVILMGNAIMYSMFYTTMKIITEGESICWEAILYGLLSLILWLVGSYFFLNVATHWSRTPAQSRLLNQECMFLDFYDTHDIWHIVSAPALFFSFLFLMALDDDLYDKKQTDIKAF